MRLTQRCCPENQHAVIVTMRPGRGRDPWYVGGIEIHFVRNLPGKRNENDQAVFELHSSSEQPAQESRENGPSPKSATPKVVVLGRNDTIALPQGAELRFLRFKGSRALLAICYQPDSLACRAMNANRSLRN